MNHHWIAVAVGLVIGMVIVAAVWFLTRPEFDEDGWDGTDE